MHSTSTLLIEFGAIVFALGMLARLAHRFAISPIPFYLLAGLMFGTGGLFPLIESGELIEVFAEMGLVLLLLLLGLEYSAEELVISLRSSAISGMIDFALNFTPGVLAGLILGFHPLTCVVLGGVTYVSSSGVIAKTLSDLGRLGNRETPTILSILVLEDLAMAIYLPIVTGLLIGGGFSDTLKLVTLAIGTVVFILLAALRYGHVLSQVMGRTNDEVLLLSILGLAVMVAGVAEQMHVSAAVGAFLVGIALSGPVANNARELLSPLRDLFAAVFFVFFGLQTDPGLIPSVAVAAICLALGTSATKVATGWLAAKRAGIKERGRRRAGFSLIARGEFSIIIAGLAQASGLDPKIASLAATYVLVLAVVGPILTRFFR